MYDTSFPLKTPETIAAIKKWWTVFLETEDKITTVFSNQSEKRFDIAAFMHEHFAAIHPNMSWEFGPGKNKSHVLVIAPERSRDLEPLARFILQQAPECKHFEFQLNRGFETWEIFKQHNNGRIQWNGPEGILFSLAPGKQSMLDLVFYIPKSLKSETAYHSCFITAESLLGEAVMAKWIHYFDVADIPKKKLFSKPLPANFLPLAQLRETIDSHIAKIKNNLPQKPLFPFSKNSEWTMVSMEAEEEEDYFPLQDLIVAQALSVDLFEAYFSGRSRFYSDRFTQCGEHFIFIQTDLSSIDSNITSVEDRGKIEDALDTALGSESFGGHIGGGTGLRYAYITLAVTNLSKAIPIIRATLQTAKLAHRSWIMFHDTDREQEWIGIWDDTPAPKLPSLDLS